MPQTDHGLVYDTVEGAGQAVVFIHGWLGRGASWNVVRRHLDTGSSMVWYDQRCHGDSFCAPFSMEDLAADLETVVAAAGVDTPVLAGHSMGGMVALTYAVKHPDNVAGLFLAATCADTPEPTIESPQFFLDQFDDMDREQWAEKIVDNYTSTNTPDGIRDAVKQQLLAAEDTPIRYGLQAMIDYDLKAELSGIDVPAVVIGGTQDRAITPEKVEELADILACPQIMLDASHDMIPHEIPDQLADQLARFLASL